MTTSKIKPLLLCIILFTFFSEVYRQGRRTKKQIKKYIKSKRLCYKNQQNLMTRFRKTHNKKFVVVIASYNNEKYCEKNLLSVFDQNYDDYRIIYINDNSNDRTLQKVQDFVAFKGLGHRIKIINNDKRVGKMQNLFNAYHSCENDEIIVCVDGDDALAHSSVLHNLNLRYQNPDVWMTYGSAIVSPSGLYLRADCFDDSVINSRSMREHTFGMHMLRTFYAGLFKQLELKDFLFKDVFLPSADDMQIMLSLFELAPTHCLALEEINYVINDENPQRTVKTFGGEESYIGTLVSMREKKKELDKNFNPRAMDLQLDDKVDVLLFSFGGSDELFKQIENLKKNFGDIGKVAVLFGSNLAENDEKIEGLKKVFPGVCLFNMRDYGIVNVLNTLSSNYVLFNYNHVDSSKKFMLKNAISTLEKTKIRACLLNQLYEFGCSSIGIHNDFNVLSTLSNSMTENYKGAVVARRRDLINAFNGNKQGPNSFAISQYLNCFKQDYFLCLK